MTFLASSFQRRLRPALAVSVTTHVAAFVLAVLLARLAPESASDTAPQDRSSYSVVWIPSPGPGGGGGGGGNESLDLPRELERVAEADKTDSLNTPPMEPVPVDARPEVEPEVLSAINLKVPLLAMASASQERMGTLDALALSASIDAQGSGTDRGAGSGTGTGSGPGDGAGLGPGSDGGAGGDVYRVGSEVVPPRAIDQVKPRYTADAVRARIQGTVWMEVVVLADGTVGDVRVTRSLDSTFGLDDEAVIAAKLWRFLPGSRHGVPVAVLVLMGLDFVIH